MEVDNAALNAAAAAGAPAPQQKHQQQGLGMPDLIGTLAGQVHAYSNETLSCWIYELSRPREGGLGGHSCLSEMGSFHRNRHAPRGLVEARFHDSASNYRTESWPCRSERALQQLLDEVEWDPRCRYFLMMRSGLPGNDGAVPWPEGREPTQAWDRLAIDADFSPDEARLREYVGDAIQYPGNCLIKILYVRDWEEGDHPAAYQPGMRVRAWRRIMAGTCAEAVYTLIGEC